MLTAEAILAAISLANNLVTMFRGKAKFADGTVLDQSHVDAAWAKADAPFARIEERAQDELDKLADLNSPRPPYGGIIK